VLDGKRRLRQRSEKKDSDELESNVTSHEVAFRVGRWLARCDSLAGGFPPCEHGPFYATLSSGPNLTIHGSLLAYPIHYVPALVTS
jgi:hypothetical protein